jgi:hypothetical protein
MKRITQPIFFAFIYLCYRAMGRSHAEVKAYMDSVIKKHATETTATTRRLEQ